MHTIIANLSDLGERRQPHVLPGGVAPGTAGGTTVSASNLSRPSWLPPGYGGTGLNTGRPSDPSKPGAAPARFGSLKSASGPRVLPGQTGREPRESGDGLSGIFSGFDTAFTNLWRTVSNPWKKIVKNPKKLNIGDIVSLVPAAAPVVSMVRNPRDTPYLVGTAAAIYGGAVGAGALLAPAGSAGAYPAGTAFGVYPGGTAFLQAAPVVANPYTFAAPVVAPMLAPAAESFTFAAAPIAPVAGALPAPLAGTAPLMAPGAGVLMGEGVVAPGTGPLLAGSKGFFDTTAGGLLVGAGKAVGTAALMTGTNLIVAAALSPKGGAPQQSAMDMFGAGPQAGAGSYPMAASSPYGGDPGASGDGSGAGIEAQLASAASNPVVLGAVALFLYVAFTGKGKGKPKSGAGLL